MTLKTEQWYLKQEFLIADMDRIDNEEYFSSTFSCPDLDIFISELRTADQAYRNKAIINTFFDRLISSGSSTKSVYVGIKWVAYIHKLIRGFKEDSVMHGLMLKALQVYVERCDTIYRRCFPGQQGRGRGCDVFERYLFTTLLKPYIQYLIKLLLLSFSVRGRQDEVTKHDINSDEKENLHPAALNLKTGEGLNLHGMHTLKGTYVLNNTAISTKNVLEARTVQSLSAITGQDKYGEEHLIQWYRSYNFVLSTLESFNDKLSQTQPFFSSELPYLCNIRRYIANDLKQQLRTLKNTCIPLDDLNMTMIELDGLETSVGLFSLFRSEESIFDINESILCTGIEDYTKEDITNFMCSPFKQNPSEIKCKSKIKPNQKLAQKSVSPGAILYDNQ